MIRATLRKAPAQPFAALAVAVFSLAGCGGGGGGTPPDVQPPPAQSMSGIVIDGPLQGATVCLDLNKNGSCDASEPTSSATDAQGRYTISGLTLDQANAGAPLIALVPATAIDASNPTTTVGTAYTLTAPAGAPAVISPITTLVQTGIVQGMSKADAEAAVAAQLQVGATSLYNDYTKSSTGDNAALASVVPAVVASLQAGETPVVGAATATAANYWVRLLNFASADNYTLRYYYSSNVPDASGAYTYYDVRTGMSGGSPLTSSNLYDTAVFATPQGWKTFNGATPNTSTTGSPYVSTWGNGYTYVSTRVDTDVSGQTLASVVSQAQDLNVNTLSTLVGVNANALSGTLPTGSKIRRIDNRNTGTPVAYRALDGFIGFGVTNLAGLVAQYPVPTTPSPNSTASMGLLHGNAGCSSTICTKERLRVAFGPNNAASYYLCDVNTATKIDSNCSAAGTGTYSLETAADGSTPIMKFAGLPAETSVQTFTRVFVERDGRVYYGWQDKLSSTKQTRLNRVAFEALAAALAITPPTIGDAASVYAGTWSASYIGSDTGNCASVFIDATGHLTGSCLSTGVGGNFVVSGSVTPTGAVTFTASGSTSSGATFSGAFTSTTGSGTWNWPSRSATGTWSATKQ